MGGGAHRIRTRIFSRRLRTIPQRHGTSPNGTIDKAWSSKGLVFALPTPYATHLPDRLPRVGNKLHRALGPATAPSRAHPQPPGDCVRVRARLGSGRKAEREARKRRGEAGV